ncbi:MAG: cob(I)yrinic acid a,c-diamide adenosyltransferase [Lachnospiraceae bacterium]|nr:cob(I)yrinic acid a,c-diamide adenosyltransferase [Lachnospiraceae bacterium]
MKQGYVHIYSGDGHGKSPAALGKAVMSAAAGEKVVIIQFLKEKGVSESEFISRLEPEVKIFRFEKSEVNFDELSEEKKTEEIINIKNGLNFAKKVLTTGECDLLILDEVLGLIDNNIISAEDLKNLLSVRDEQTDVIMTGISMSDEVCVLADEVSKIETMKFKRWENI